jgi:hypothetical protein
MLEQRWKKRSDETESRVKETGLSSWYLLSGRLSF